MDQRLITDWVGKERVEKWYEGLVAEWDWNARFWEQRAIAEAELGNLDKAESYGAHAVKVHRDPFTLTTYGTLLLRKVCEWADPQSSEAWEFYWRGVRSLHESRQVADRDYPHPFISFFRNTLAFAARNPEVRRGDKVVAEWDRWMRDASAAAPFAHTELLGQLSDFKEQWIRAGLVERDE